MFCLCLSRFGYLWFLPWLHLSHCRYMVDLFWCFQLDSCPPYATPFVSSKTSLFVDDISFPNATLYCCFYCKSSRLMSVYSYSQRYVCSQMHFSLYEGGPSHFIMILVLIELLIQMLIRFLIF